MAAYGNMDDAFVGMPVGMDIDVETGIAQETIGFGKPVFGYSGAPGKVYGAHRSLATLTMAGDLVTSNVMTTTINGIAVATTFATDNATSITAHIAAINAKAELIALGITAVAGSTVRIILIKSTGLDLTVATVVTLGGGQTTGAVVYGSNGKFMGIAMFAQSATVANGGGDMTYVAYDLVNVLREGQIWVPVSVAVLANDSAYGITEVTNQGKFTNVAGANYDVGGYFRSNRSTDKAILEVRGMK